MKLSSISYLLHQILSTYGYVDIYDGGDTYRILLDSENEHVEDAPLLNHNDEVKSPNNMYEAMQMALDVTRSVEECQITVDGEWFGCSHFGLEPDEEIIDSFVTDFAKEIDNGYDAQTAVESSAKAMEFMRNGDSAKDWYDLWKEGNFEEAAKIWPEAPLEANYFADTLMFVVTEE